MEKGKNLMSKLRATEYNQSSQTVCVSHDFSEIDDSFKITYPGSDHKF